MWVGAYNHRFTPTNRDVKGRAFFRLGSNALSPVVTGISAANGLAFTPDGTRMYFADTPTRQVECVDMDATTGEVSNRRTLL